MVVKSMFAPKCPECKKDENLRKLWCVKNAVTIFNDVVGSKHHCKTYKLKCTKCKVVFEYTQY